MNLAKAWTRENENETKVRMGDSVFYVPSGPAERKAMVGLTVSRSSSDCQVSRQAGNGGTNPAIISIAHF